MKERSITSVITGDIIRSRDARSSVWLPRLKKTLALEGKSPRTWQIYRGDSFQIEVTDPARALLTAVRIKAAIKSVRNLDVRMAIGIGQRKRATDKIVESDGEAFIRSGEKFETLRKEKITLAIHSPWPEFDREMNVILRLASIPMDTWSPNSAELILLLLTQKKLTQKALARRLGVSQPAVSERQNRSHIAEIMELEELYKEKITKLIS